MRVMNSYDILHRPLITEKNTLLATENRYAFDVDKRANKLQIKEAIEKAFNVKVAAVNVMTVSGKTRRFGRRAVKGPSWKKAVVTLKPGHKIELFEGV